MEIKANVADRLELISPTLALHRTGLHSGEVSQLTVLPRASRSRPLPIDASQSFQACRTLRRGRTNRHVGPLKDADELAELILDSGEGEEQCFT